MAISGDYPTPVQVNGFTCRNCTDVDYAKKHIDPAHPKSGPYGVNAADDPTRRDDPARDRAVSFGGLLKGREAQDGGRAPDPFRPGATVDLKA